MTTTLRPRSGARETPAGRRVQEYWICSNGRPVGSLRLLGPAPGQATGEIQALQVEPARRRRGHASVAVLTAEEILRSWGCARVVVRVPDGAPPADRLFSALGYRLSAQNMAKPLPDPPPSLPAGLAVRAMTPDEYVRWHAHGVETYVDALFRAEGCTLEEARARAVAAYALLLPDGPDTPGMVVRVLEAGGEPVGTLWVALHDPDRPGRGYVYYVEVAEPLRGHGYGRALMFAAERECHAAGLTEVGLTVFSRNTVAIRLYTSLGYRVIRRRYGKTLVP